MTVFRGDTIDFTPPKACASGKVPYFTEREARATMKRMRARTGKRVRSYRCPGCPAWHLTSSISQKGVRPR